MKQIKATIENLESLRHICIEAYELNFIYCQNTKEKALVNLLYSQ